MLLVEKDYRHYFDTHQKLRSLHIIFNFNPYICKISVNNSISTGRKSNQMNKIFDFFNRYRTERKSSSQDCVSLSWKFRFAPLLLRFSFFDTNSSARIRMTLKAPHIPVSL